MIAHRRYVLILAALYLALWVLLASSYRRLLLSHISYTLVFAFLALHTAGAHYTYSVVRDDPAFPALTGQSSDALMR